jgi:hypothetical protein
MHNSSQKSPKEDTVWEGDVDKVTKLKSIIREGVHLRSELSGLG